MCSHLYENMLHNFTFYLLKYNYAFKYCCFAEDKIQNNKLTVISRANQSGAIREKHSDADYKGKERYVI